MKKPSIFAHLRLLGVLSLLVACIGLSACESSSKPGTSGSRESTIPWNRPASWEGPGVYGSALGQGR